MPWLGIDIGGANLKLADGRGFALVQPFALWRDPKRLAFELRTCIALAPACDHLAVTMTAELADCFVDKGEGVRTVVGAVSEASDGRHTRFYLRTGVLVAPAVAASRPQEAAAANWHALARFAARFSPHESALLIDIGSTTCDIIPLVNGEVAARGATDTERLIVGELVYTGVERTPLCGLAETVPYRGQPCPLAQEFFATASDVYVLLGDLPETVQTDHSADGRPNLKTWARRRLARMICADDAVFNHKDAVEMARSLADAQMRKIAAAIDQVLAGMPQAATTCILSGHGDFLAQRAWDHLQISARIISLAKELGAHVSRCAPSHAVAVLAAEGNNP